jgi:3-methyl-2-oxobutanoate hydroxymethyltransferase
MSTTGRINEITSSVIREMKRRGEKITVLTAYDYPTAYILDEAEIDIILVGDSLGMVVLGYDSTIPVTMDEMIHHTKSVSRAVKRSLVIGDMPFMSYQCSSDKAIYNAGRFLKEAGAHGVKIEGGREVAEITQRMVQAGIPVMSHLGLTPQSVHQLGGFKVQGKDERAAQRILEDAKILEEAGSFSVVLECIPVELARKITDALHIPTIGIGAGVHCDGQVLVLHDVLGLFERMKPKFVKRYAELGVEIKDAVKKYAHEVRTGVFPDAEHSFLK